MNHWVWPVLGKFKEDPAFDVIACSGCRHVVSLDGSIPTLCDGCGSGFILPKQRKVAGRLVKLKIDADDWFAMWQRLRDLENAGVALEQAMGRLTPVKKTRKKK